MTRSARGKLSVQAASGAVTRTRRGCGLRHLRTMSLEVCVTFKASAVRITPAGPATNADL
jgi:hypothetical protein